MITKPELSTTLSNKLTAILEDARTLTLGGGYMAEYNDVKDRLNRRIYDESREIHNYVITWRDIAPYSYEFQGVWADFDAPSGSYQLVSAVKKLTKLVARLQKSQSPWAEVMENVLAHYIRDGYYDVITQFVASKGGMKTGRKPISASDRKTVERTIENTGTCGICGKNVKLTADGTLYAHGFQLQWQSRQGNCFGVGYEPVEVSPKTMVDYLATLESMKLSRETRLSSGAPESIEYQLNRRTTIQVTKDTPASELRHQTSYEKLAALWVYNLEREIRFLNADSKTLTKAIATWAPRPLPDAK